MVVFSFLATFFGHYNLSQPCAFKLQEVKRLHTPSAEAESWTHAVRCWQAVNDKCALIPGTCWLLLPLPSDCCCCCWKLYLSSRRSLFKVFCRLSNLQTSARNAAEWNLSLLLPSSRQTVGTEAASRVQKAGRFGTATIAVTFCGCEIQHQLWHRPLSFYGGGGGAVLKSGCSALSRCALLKI